MKKFFTLIELIIVIAVLGILTAIIIPNISDFQKEANLTAVKSNVRSLQTASDMYSMNNHGDFPSTESPSPMIPQPIDFTKIHPDYSRDLPETPGVNYWIDAWGKVWASSIDAPTSVSFDTDTLSWKSVEDAAYYNIFKAEDPNIVTSNASRGFKNIEFIKQIPDSSVEREEVNLPLLKGKETYIISSLDEEGFESAPAGAGYLGYENKQPVAVISMTPDTNITNNTTITWGSDESVDPDLDSIVKSEWQVNDISVANPPETFSNGSHNVKLRVQDENGAWSNWIAKTFTVQSIVEYNEYVADSGYSKIIYVDGINGSDSGNGTKTNPYKTLQKALPYANNGDAVKLGKGEYILPEFNDIFERYNVDYIGSGKDTIVKINNSSVFPLNVKNKVYSMVIMPNNTFRNNAPSSGAAKRLIIGHSYTVTNYDVEIHNVAFTDPYDQLVKNQRHSSFIATDGSSGVEHNYTNFKFINSAAVGTPMVTVWSDYHSGGVYPNIQLINSATTVSNIDCGNDECGYGYEQDPLKLTNIIENASFDSNFNITSGSWINVGSGNDRDGSIADIGVYGGPYGW